MSKLTPQAQKTLDALRLKATWELRDKVRMPSIRLCDEIDAIIDKEG